MDKLHYPMLFAIPAQRGWSVYRATVDDKGEIVEDEKGHSTVRRCDIGAWGIDLPYEQRQITLPGAASYVLPAGGFFGGGVDELRLVPLDLSGGRLDGKALILISPPGETPEQAMARILAAEQKAGRR